MAETGLKLRTAAPSGDWRSFLTTAPTGGCDAGDMDMIHDTVGVYMQTADEGDDVAFCYHAEKIVVPKSIESGDAFEVGDKVFYDTTYQKVTTATSGDYWIGICLEAATDEDTEVLIDLKGDKAHS